MSQVELVVPYQDPYSLLKVTDRQPARCRQQRLPLTKEGLTLFPHKVSKFLVFLAKVGSVSEFFKGVSQALLVVRGFDFGSERVQDRSEDASQLQSLN